MTAKIFQFEAFRAKSTDPENFVVLVGPEIDGPPKLDAEEIALRELEMRLLARDVQFYTGNQDYMKEVGERCEFVISHLVLKHRTTVDDSLEFEKRVVARMSLDDLCCHLFKSGRADWRKRNAHYQALILELEARLRLVEMFEDNLRSSPDTTKK